MLNSGQVLSVTPEPPSRPPGSLDITGPPVCPQRYRLGHCLGQHAGRQTWAAIDLETTQPVVLKLLAFSDELVWQSFKLFEREARLLQALDHPRLPRFRQSFSLSQGWLGIAQDYIPGHSLKALLLSGHRFEEAEVRQIAQEVLQILTDIHRLSPPILHRDIKPSNLIRGEAGEIYLIDWGAVQEQGATPGQSFTIVGTYGYTPLEQFGGRAVPASDLYALGTTLIHLLSGTAPADLPQRDLRIQFLGVPGGVERDRLSPELERWLQRMTHPEPQQRFASAAEAQAALLQPEAEGSSGSSGSSGAGLIARSYRSARPPAVLDAQRPSPTSGIRVQRSPHQLLIDLPGSDLGPVILGLGGVFLGISLLLNFLLSPLFLLLALVLGGCGLWLSARLRLRLERRGDDRLRLRLCKRLLGRSLRHRQEQNVQIQRIFHRLPFPEQRLDLHQPNRTLIIQTAQQEYALPRVMTRAESTWLQQEIHQWLEADPDRQLL